MKRSLLIAVCCLARLAPAQQPGCALVERRGIYGKDLAAAFAAFGPLPEDLQIGAMPFPGSIRTFHSPELLSLAERYSIRLDHPPDICFEWPMAPLDPDRVLAAMRKALPEPDARIEIAELSPYRTPRGALEFPRETLVKPGSPDQRGPVLWRGNVVYGDGLRYAVWARVRITANCGRLVAAENLKPGVPIASNQFRAETVQGFPDPDRCVASPGDVAGLAPVRFIAAGGEIRASLLAPPYDVKRGEEVEVEVRSGRARLALTAKAESSGRNGDVISIRNPSSNRVFQARIDGKARAFVVADLPGGY